MGTRGRPPVDFARTLRVYLVQRWFGEDVIADSRVLRASAEIELTRKSEPNPTTLLQFRDRSEKCGLTKKLVATAGSWL